jgi:cold-inducible RNA-binding protein
MGKRLYVGNLPYDANEASLRQVFAQDGRVVDRVHLVLDRETQRPRGFAFVELATDDMARAAIAALDGKLFGTRQLRVTEAEERRPGPGPGGGGPPGRPGPGAPGGGGAGAPSGAGGPSRPGAAGAGASSAPPARPAGGDDRHRFGPDARPKHERLREEQRRAAPPKRRAGGEVENDRYGGRRGNRRFDDDDE